MPDSQVITEFLVSLGFRLDDSQRQKFDAALAGSRAKAEQYDKTLGDLGKQLGVVGDRLVQLSGDPTRKAVDASDRLNKQHQLLTANVKALGLTAVATTSTFVIGFTEIAKRYDSLFYAAQRTGVATGQLAAQQFAGGQVGGLDIAGAQQRVAMVMQTQPGISALFRSTGTDLKQVIDRIYELSGGNAYLIKQFAEMAGLSYEFAISYEKNQDRIAAAQKEYIELMARMGIDTTQVFGDPAKKKIGEVNQAVQDLNSIWNQLNGVMVAGFHEAFPVIDQMLKRLNDLGNKNADLIKQHPGVAMAEVAAGAYATAAGGLTTAGIFSSTMGSAGLAMLGFGTGAGLGAGVASLSGDVPTDPGTAIPGSAMPAFLAQGGSLEQWLRSLFGGSVHDPLRRQRPPPPEGPLRGYAEGGAITRTGPILAHAGETIVPTQEGSGFITTLDELTRAVVGWLLGSSAYRPMVQVVGWSPGVGNGDGGIGGGGGGGAGGPATHFPTGDATGPVTQQIISTMRAAGATPAVIQGVIAAALGEGGVSKPWLPGDHGTSFGPWQLHQGGRLNRYIEGGNKPGDVEAQTKYVMETMLREVGPGFLKLTDPAMVVKMMHDIFRDNGASVANLGRAAAVLGKFVASAGAETTAPAPSPSAGGPFHGYPTQEAEQAAIAAHGGRMFWPGHAPPGVKFNSRGDPYTLNMTPEERAHDAKASEDWKRATLHHGSFFPKATLGGHTMINNDAGDRSVALSQTNHVTVQGGDAATGHRIAEAVNREAGWMSVNAHSALS